MKERVTNRTPSIQKRAIHGIAHRSRRSYHHNSTMKLEPQLTNYQTINLTSRMGKRGGKRVSMSDLSFERLVKLMDSSLEADEAEAVEISVHRNEQIPRIYPEPIHFLSGITTSLELYMMGKRRIIGERCDETFRTASALQDRKGT